MNEPRLPRERYQLLGLLGTGGMASVWRVLDVRLDVERAVKVLPPGVLREAQLAARLSHPHVISVHDVLDLPDGTGIVMELAQGSLEDRVVTDGPLPVRAAARVMADVCDALDAAHALGIVHRDVKPANLLVCEGGAGGPRVKLADFGIAGLLDADAPAESTRALLGSLPYMAPEQRRGEGGPASDVYGAAVTLAWLVTGALPGDLYVDEVRSGLRARLDAEDGDALVALLARAGAHDPAARPDAATLRDALRELAGDAVVRIGPLTRGPAPQARPGRWVRVGDGESVGPAGVRAGAWSARAAWGVALLALGVGVGGGVWAGLQDGVRGRLIQQTWSELPVCSNVPQFASVAMPDSIDDSPGLREAGIGAVGDIDNDGVMDFAWPHSLDASVRVFWGDRRTYLSNSISDVRLDRAPINLEIADLDGDGDLDFLQSNTEQSRLGWAKNLGKMLFDEPRFIDETCDPEMVRVARWDEDPKPDILLSCQGNRLVVRLYEARRSDNYGYGVTLRQGVEAWDVWSSRQESVVLVAVLGDGTLHFKHADAADWNDVVGPFITVTSIRTITGSLVPTWYVRGNTEDGRQGDVIVTENGKRGTVCRLAHDSPLRHFDAIIQTGTKSWLAAQHISSAYTTSSYIAWFVTSLESSNN